MEHLSAFASVPTYRFDSLLERSRARRLARRPRTARGCDNHGLRDQLFDGGQARQLLLGNSIYPLAPCRVAIGSAGFLRPALQRLSIRIENDE